jgi:hypothetical protein
MADGDKERDAAKSARLNGLRDCLGEPVTEEDAREAVRRLRWTERHAPEQALTDMSAPWMRKLAALREVNVDLTAYDASPPAATDDAATLSAAGSGNCRPPLRVELPELRDLRKSGWTDAFIHAQGVYTATSAEHIAPLLGHYRQPKRDGIAKFEQWPRVDPADPMRARTDLPTIGLVKPMRTPGTPPKRAYAYRVRLRYPRANLDEKSVDGFARSSKDNRISVRKYETPTGMANTPIGYPVHNFDSSRYSDSGLPLLITEGYKKAGALVQAGHVAISLSGIWMAADYELSKRVTLECSARGLRKHEIPAADRWQLSPLITRYCAIEDRTVIVAFDHYHSKPPDLSDYTGECRRVAEVAAALRLAGMLYRVGARTVQLAAPLTAPTKGVDDVYVAAALEGRTHDLEQDCADTLNHAAGAAALVTMLDVALEISRDLALGNDELGACLQLQDLLGYDWRKFRDAQSSIFDFGNLAAPTFPHETESVADSSASYSERAQQHDPAPSEAVGGVLGKEPREASHATAFRQLAQPADEVRDADSAETAERGDRPQSQERISLDQQAPSDSIGHHGRAGSNPYIACVPGRPMDAVRAIRGLTSDLGAKRLGDELRFFISPANVLVEVGRPPKHVPKTYASRSYASLPSANVATVESQSFAAMISDLCAIHVPDRSGANMVPGELPTQITRTLLDRPWEMGFGVLAGLSEVPTLDSDGRVIAARGYDEKTGLYMQLRDAVPLGSDSDPPKRGPQHLGRYDHAVAMDPQGARDSFERLVAWFSQFPFAEPHHVASYAAYMLTIALRHMIQGHVPVFAFDGNAGDLGKTLLSEAGSLVAAGYGCADISLFGSQRRDAELLGLVASGLRTVRADDITTGTLVKDERIQQLVTTSTLTGKALYSPTTKIYSWSAVVCLTGVGLSYSTAIASRALPVRLDATKRRNEPLSVPRFIAGTISQRPQLLAWLLGIARPHLLARMPRPPGLKPWDRYRAWDDIVRCSIIAASGIDPLLGIGEVRANAAENDPDRNTLLELVDYTDACRGTVERDGLTYFIGHDVERDVSELDRTGSRSAANRPGLRAALIERLSKRSQDLLSARTIGQLLGKLFEKATLPDSLFRITRVERIVGNADRGFAYRVGLADNDVDGPFVG